jgi:hypothetical protein
MPSVCICVWARYYYLAESSNCRAHISQFDLLGQFLSFESSKGQIQGTLTKETHSVTPARIFEMIYVAVQ